MKRLLALIVLVFSLLVLPATAQDSPLRVLATTTLIADVAANVGGDRVEVTALVPPGADVHAFQPTPQDVLLVAEADVVLVNGAGLEEFLEDLVANAAGVEPVVVSNGIHVLPFGDHEHDHDADHMDEADSHDDEHEGEHHEAHIGVLGEDADCGDHTHEDDGDHADEGEHHEEGDHADGEHDHGACDPHFWTDPANAAIWAGNIAEAFAAADPANAETYRANAAAYSAELDALDAEIESILAVIPTDERVIVTNHEFLAYFAHRYEFEVVGVVLGNTTLAEPEPQAVAALVQTINAEGVTAIFAEVSDPGRLASVIAEEAGDVQIVTLYSGSLSEADGPAATYLDYLRYNAQAIADALVG